MSYGKIAFAGVTIAVTGWMLLIAIPFMFSVVWYFIDKAISLFSFMIGIVVLAIFVYEFLNRH